MLDMILTYVLLPAISVLWLVTRYLWVKQDAKHEDGIAVLFALHKEDAEKLEHLRILIAGKHYERSELDERFKQLDTTLREGFKELGVDIRNMAQSLHDTYRDHVKEHHAR